MAEFISFDENVEVNGETVSTVINAFPEYLTGMAIRILKEHGIDNPTPGQWYNQQLWLNAFKEISDKFGANTLFEIGKAIPSYAKFPVEINTMESALASINEAYRMNHRGGNIGFYKLVKFNEHLKNAIMHCNNPYPCDFDRGIITTMARKFRPIDSNFPEALLDRTKPSRKNGADESWYVVSW